MADRVESFQITAIAGTAKAAAIETLTTFPAGVVQSLTVVVPAASDAGIQIAYAHQPIIPRSSGQFIQAQSSSQSLPLSVSGQPNGGAWSVFAYNTTATNVQFQVLFQVFELSSVLGVDFSQPLSAGQIYTATPFRAQRDRQAAR